MFYTAPNASDITSRLPLASRDADAMASLEQLSLYPPLAPLLAAPLHRDLITAAAGNAPYLARLIGRYPDYVAELFSMGLDTTWGMLTHSRYAVDMESADTAAMMKHLRTLKAKCALTTALADISGAWTLEQVTHALAGFAGDAVTIALRFLLLKAAQRGELQLGSTETPEAGTGIIILGMGKLGAFELNYSSDIDLFILFDKDALPSTGSRYAQVFMY